MELFGMYDSTIFRNEANGYTIFKLKLNEFIPEFDNIRVVCKGIFSYSLMCLPLKLTGSKVSSDFGDSFEFTNIEPYIRNEKEAINFLSSSSFRGISPKLAKKIVKQTGEDIFSLVHNPDAYVILTSIEGIAANKAKMILSTLSKAKHQKDVLEFISKYSSSFHSAETLIEKHGENAILKIINNPYIVGAECDLPFLACDMIARDYTGLPYDQKRINAIVYQVMNKDYQSGNVYITLPRLVKNVNYISKSKSAFPNYEISPYQIAICCDTTPFVKTVIEDDEIRYYFTKAYSDELRIAKNVKRLNRTKVNHKLNINKIIKECEEELDIKYSEKQKDCFNFLRSNGVKIITGGPGTGKSTVINGLTYAFSKLYPEKKIVMMAPTGRAAQRINEITGREAGTIHRMLEVSPFDDSVQAGYYADYPADMIVVDESSMIDNELMSILTEGVKNNCLLIMVGDIDQLPSIGAGAVLKDLINAKIETVKLDVVYRQKGKSLIIENAIAVNSGSFDIKTDDDFILNTFNSGEALASAVVNTFLPLYDIKNPYSIQILCPQKKGIAGIKTLNQEIQSKLTLGKVVAAYGPTSFRKGDKIIATINNYDIGYFNGDVGIIVESNDLNFLVAFNKEILAIPKENISDFQLAYACTIHKSQGSEYETVIICLPRDAIGMTQRNLLYTAITRAKKKVIIMAENNCVEKAIMTTKTDLRKSSLAQFVTADFAA